METWIKDERKEVLEALNSGNEAEDLATILESFQNGSRDMKREWLDYAKELCTSLGRNSEGPARSEETQ